MNVAVTRADVREFVENTSTGVLVDSVVSELEARLHLVGDHPATTVLTASTVQPWSAIRVQEDLGDDEYGKILRANAG